MSYIPTVGYVSCLQECLLISSGIVIAIRLGALMFVNDIYSAIFLFVLNIYFTERHLVRALFDRKFQTKLDFTEGRHI